MPIIGVRVGGGVTDTRTEVRSGAARTTAANNYMTFESPVGTDLQVTAAKTLFVYKMAWESDTNDTGFQLLYGDTGVADGAAAPTTPVLLGERFSAKVSNTRYEMDTFFTVPASKFPAIRQIGASTNVAVLIWCIEV